MSWRGGRLSAVLCWAALGRRRELGRVVCLAGFAAVFFGLGLDLDIGASSSSSSSEPISRASRSGSETSDAAASDGSSWSETTSSEEAGGA